MRDLFPNFGNTPDANKDADGALAVPPPPVDHPNDYETFDDDVICADTEEQEWELSEFQEVNWRADNQEVVRRLESGNKTRL